MNLYERRLHRFLKKKMTVTSNAENVHLQDIEKSQDDATLAVKKINGHTEHDPSDDILSRTLSKVEERPWIDKGWAWLVALGSLSVTFVCMGQIRNMGLLLAEVKIHFTKSTAIAAVLPSVVYLLMPMMSPISSMLTTRFGSRPVVLAGCIITVLAHVSVMFATNVVHVVVFYAVPLGVGTGLCYTATAIIIGKYFHKRSSFAFGMATSGAPIAGILLPAFYTYLSDLYGFQGAILLLGGVAAHATIGACLMRPLEFWEPCDKTGEQLLDSKDVDDPKTLGHHNEKEHMPNLNSSLLRLNSQTSQLSCKTVLGDTLTVSQFELNQIDVDNQNDESEHEGQGRVISCLKKINKTFRFTLLKEAPFVIHLVVSCCGMVGYVLSYALAPSHALDMGIDRMSAYNLISIGGFGDLPSRYILSFLTDKWSAKPYGEKYHIMSVSMLISGLNTILLAFSTSYGAMCAHMVFIGFFGGGGFIGANVAVLKATIGLTKTANGGLGILMFVSGILIGIAPPLMGLIRDQVGSFKIPFLITGVVMMFGGCFTWLQVVAKRNQRKEHSEHVTLQTGA